ncbi:hypothetical protein GCM10027423_11900 [Spirosoma arcticum]
MFLLTGVCLLVKVAPITAQRSVIWQEKPGTWSLNVGAGPSRYLGDFNERFNLAHLQTGVALSAATVYRLTDQLALRGDVQIYYIRGTQKDTHLEYNNLSFRSLNPDLSVGVQYDFWPSQDRNHTIIPYGVAGFGLTYMTPKATYSGATYSLAPLHTEDITYNRLPLILRYGVGVPLFSMTRFKGNIEGLYTHVMSDYLDDVSTVYPDRSGMTPVAASLSDRRMEIGTAPNSAGAKRGNPKRNDGYLIVSARLIYTLITPRQRNYRRQFSR